MPNWPVQPVLNQTSAKLAWFGYKNRFLSLKLLKKIRNRSQTGPNRDELAGSV